MSGESSVTDRPLVSAVITTHNRPELLTRAVQSVVAQQYRPLELVVVDDGSKPEVGSIAADDLPIRIVRHEVARGPGSARNAGVAAASGEFVCFLDDDDWWLPTRVSVAVAGIQGNRMHAVNSSRGVRSFSGDMRRTLTLGRMPLVGQVMFRRDDFMEFDPAMRVAEDTDWWLAMHDQAIFGWTSSAELQIGDNTEPRPGVDADLRVRCRIAILRKRRKDLDRHERAVQMARIAAAAVLAKRRRTVLRYALWSVVTTPTRVGLTLVLHALAPWEVGRAASKKSKEQLGWQ